MSLFDEDVQRDGEMPFRVAAIVRRSLAMAVPFAPRSYIDDSRQDMDALCTSEWDFVVQTVGRAVHSLAHSLPPDDAMRSLAPEDGLSPHLGADLVIPTSEDLELDIDYIPASRPAVAGADRVVREAAAADDPGEVSTWLARRALGDDATEGKLPAEHFDRAPAPVMFTARRSVYLAAEDAYRWLMWRRMSYLMGDDPEGVRVISTWAHIVDRALSGQGFDTGLADRSRDDLAIDRPF